MTVIAAIEPAVLTVEPGGTVTATIRVRNQGSVVDQFDLSVLGDAQSWATIEPANLRLFPRTEGEAIHLRAAAGIDAGRRPLLVRHPRPIRRRSRRLRR